MSDDSHSTEFTAADLDEIRDRLGRQNPEFLSEINDHLTAYRQKRAKEAGVIVTELEFWRDHVLFGPVPWGQDFPFRKAADAAEAIRLAWMAEKLARQAAREDEARRARVAAVHSLALPAPQAPSVPQAPHEALPLLLPAPQAVPPPPAKVSHEKIHEALAALIDPAPRRTITRRIAREKVPLVVPGAREEDIDACFGDARYDAKLLRRRRRRVPK